MTDEAAARDDLLAPFAAHAAARPEAQRVVKLADGWIEKTPAPV